MKYELNYKMTPHFEYGEVIKSRTALLNGIDNNIPTQKLFDTAVATCQFMELVRALFIGYYIAISSFFRCNKLNFLIGSSLKSQHPKAEAVDFTVPGVRLKDVFLVIAKSTLNYDQLIWEYGQWIHISHKQGGLNRRELLVCQRVNGKTEYKTYTSPTQLV